PTRRPAASATRRRSPLVASLRSLQAGSRRASGLVAAPRRGGCGLLRPLDRERVLEVLGTQAARHAATVDEERRRRLDADLGADRDVGRDLSRRRRRREAALELALIETEARRVADQA